MTTPPIGSRYGEKPEPPTSPPIFAVIAGERRLAHPDAVLWFLEHHPRKEDGPPFTVQRAARCAAAERIAYDRANGMWWERTAAEGFPGWIRLRLYELDRFIGESAIYPADDRDGQRLALAWLVLDELEPSAPF